MSYELPEELVEAGIMTSFKRRLVRYKARKGLERYGSYVGEWD